jgi:hypothetical protein
LAEEINFRLGAVRAHPAAEGEDDFEQILASLEEVMGLTIDLRTTVEEIENWVYSTMIALRKATGARGTTPLWWDGEKFVPRPAEFPPIVPPEVEPTEPKPEPKSRLPRGRD